MSETTPTPTDDAAAAPEFVQLVMVMSDWTAADTLARALMETGAAEHVENDPVGTRYFRTATGGFEWNDEERRVTVRARAERVEDVVAVMRAGFDYEPEHLEITITPILALVTADPAVIAEAQAAERERAAAR